MMMRSQKMRLNTAQREYYAAAAPETVDKLETLLLLAEEVQQLTLLAITACFLLRQILVLQSLLFNRTLGAVSS